MFWETKAHSYLYIAVLRNRIVHPIRFEWFLLLPFENTEKINHWPVFARLSESNESHRCHGRYAQYRADVVSKLLI